MGPEFNMIGALVRRKFKHRDTNIQGRGRQADTGVMHLWAKECQRTPEARKKQRSVLPWTLKHKHGSADTLILD